MNFQRASCLLALCCLTLLSACALETLVKPDVAIVNALFTNVNFLETEMEFTIRLENHTPETLVIDGAVHRISINGDEIGTGSDGTHLEIPRFGSASQKVRISLSNFSMFNQLRDVVGSKHFDYEIESEFYYAHSGLLGHKAKSIKKGKFDFHELDSGGSSGGF